MAATATSNWFEATIAITVAVISASTALSVYVFKKKSKELNTRIRELENSLTFSEKKCNAERQGRIRAQQAVRKALTDGNSGKSKQTSYPMAPIGVVQSCFSTRNGTPRQPLLVPLARACLVFDTSQVPLAALEGLTQYSHCWIIYVFHLNTNLDKLWKLPSKSRFKAKVRVPRLKGGRMGVFATRSPHRPCPIGLTVAKVEAVQGNMVLLSGVDLVNGTPVLDIKPYLPFCDSIQEARVPEWITGDNLAVMSVNFTEEFSSTLANCWVTTENKSLYASPTELQSLIKQVLSWDIRSLSQHKKPHNSVVKEDSQSEGHHVSDLEDDMDEDVPTLRTEQDPVSSPEAVTYYLLLEGLDVAYRIDRDGNVFVEKATLSSDVRNKSRYSCNYTMWRDVLG